MDLSTKTSLISALILCLLGTRAQAEVFHGIVNCAPTELTLEIKNQSRSWQRAWTQVRNKGQIDEIQWSIEPGKTLHIQGSEFLNLEKNFSVKTVDTTTLRLSSSCKNGSRLLLISLVSANATHYLPSQVKTIKVSLTNLYIRKQVLTLRAFNKNKALIAERKEALENSYDTQFFKWTLPEDISFIEVQGPQRMSSQVLFESSGKESQSPGISPTPTMVSADSTKTYFMVSTKSTAEESFVIALDNNQQIETARDQIRNPALEKIVVAGIELSHGNNNRNFLSRDKAVYSWHVNRVDAFADFAHIDCDGSPDLTEERLEQKLTEGGRICFWRYRVVRELTLDEVNSGILSKP